ncbi:MAG: carboxypeptidase-like regulatory domain-containing protein [Muribaculaceae bacterium]
MARGKQTCRILKEIRRQIAEANGIEFITSECRYRGDCLGTCPKCEAEVRYLEQQLRVRSLTGKAVALAGISAGALALLSMTASSAQPTQESNSLMKGSVPAMTDTIKVKGIVVSGDTLPNGTIAKEPLIGATIVNRRTALGTVTDVEGNFSLPACVGDSLEVSYVGYNSMTIAVTKEMADTTITLAPSQALLGEMVVAGMAPAIGREENHYLDLKVVDEHGRLIDRDKLDIERIWTDSDGEEDYEPLSPEYFDEKHPCRIYWDNDWGLQDEDGTPLKEATLRILAEGYDDPIIIKVKYPKRTAKRNIRFKRK